MAAGATLVVPSSRRAGDPSSPAGPTGPDPEEWLRLVEDHGVTIWNAVPAFMELLVNHVEQIGRHLPECLRLVMMSGDWIPPTLPERIHRLSGRKGEGIRVISLGVQQRQRFGATCLRLAVDGVRLSTVGVVFHMGALCEIRQCISSMTRRWNTARGG